MSRRTTFVSPAFRRGFTKGFVNAFNFVAAFEINPEPASVQYRRRRLKGEERLRQSFRRSWEQLTRDVEIVKV